GAHPLPARARSRLRERPPRPEPHRGGVPVALDLPPRARRARWCPAAGPDRPRRGHPRRAHRVGLPPLSPRRVVHPSERLTNSDVRRTTPGREEPSRTTHATRLLTNGSLRAATDERPARPTAHRAQGRTASARRATHVPRRPPNSSMCRRDV